MRRAASVLATVLLIPAGTGAQVERFTAEDMLKVVTAAVLDVSEDGRYVAFTERRAIDNAETNNYRYGDPTFLAPSAVRLVVVDVETGRRLLPLGDRLVNVRQAAFSRDGRRLAVLTASGTSSTSESAISLLVGDTASEVKPVDVKSHDVIAANSSLERAEGPHGAKGSQGSHAALVR
jgi:dipeptidyl aminopeptidase/acylaminoacyl peptidase